jgi:F-type H+-transporting ATPase subunit a
MRLRSLALGLLMSLPVTGVLAQAQEPHGPRASNALDKADIIMPHITDSKEVELPCIKSWGEWSCGFTLPTWNVTIGGTEHDLGPTRHVFYMVVASLLSMIFLVGAARSHRRDAEAIGRPKGSAAGLEAVILYLRREIYIPALGGHGGEAFVPFVLSLFFFILFCNALGLIPYGGTPTGNLAVTATLAAITFVVIEIAGMRTLGAGYISTIVYWPHDMPIGIKLALTPIMTPIELVGKFTKPFALTIRLFANMIAGHVMILALIGLAMTFGWLVGLAPLLMALGIMALELLVSVLQAFIFSLLAAVFIGQIRTAHH